MEFSNHQLGIVKASPMSSIDDLKLRPPVLVDDIECISSPTTKNTNMDVMASLSVGDRNVSLTVVVQPTHKECLRLSFPGTLPIETSHLRGHTEDSDRTGRFSFGSEESSAGSSERHSLYEGGGYNTDFSASQERFYEAPENMLISWFDLHKIPRSVVMQNGYSNESQIDPFFSLDKDGTVEKGKNSNIQSNQKLMRTLDYKFITSASDSGHDHQNNLLNLFPSPPSFQGSNSDAIMKKMSGQGGELACIRINQGVQTDSIQSILNKKETRLDWQHITSHSHTSAAFSGFEPCPELNPRSLRLPSFDFDTYRGLINDMRFTKLLFDPDELEHIANRPLSFEAGAPEVLGEPDVFMDEEEEVKEHDIASMKYINLEKAQLCIVRDENGKEKPFKEVVERGRTIVIFLRYFCCRQSQEYVQKISQSLALGTPARKTLNESKSTIVFIGLGCWKLISNYRDYLDPSFKFFTDSSATSQLFRKMGLHRTVLGGSLSAGLPQKLKLRSPNNHLDSIAQLRAIFCLENLLQGVGGAADLITPSTKEKRLITKISVRLAKVSKRKSPRIAALEGNPDPFRRSFVGTQFHLSEKEDALSLIRCTHAYRIKSTESNARASQLFRSIGLDILNELSS